MKLGKKIFGYLGKHGATLLSVAAAAGVVLTAVETAKATTKAQSLIDMNKAEPMSKKEVVEECWRYYIPAAIVGVGTIACILGSNTMNKKTQKELMAAYVAVQQTYSAYRRKVAEQVGREVEQNIHKDVGKETPKENGDVVHLFYEPNAKKYFHATMAQVIEAAYDFNRALAIDGGVSLNEWYNFLGTDELTITPEGDLKGWCIDQLIEDWDYYWMEFEYDKQTTDWSVTTIVRSSTRWTTGWSIMKVRTDAKNTTAIMKEVRTNEQEKEHLEDSGYGRDDIWLSRHDDAGICRG